MPKTRYSKQRELIYENLKARCDHPTAEAIYSDLKKDNPGLSLGTLVIIIILSVMNVIKCLTSLTMMKTLVM